MTIEDMQYDFKKKLNKIDSQQYKNLLIPEIDWTLNEAAELFVKMVAEPRLKSHLGFEKSQRGIDDIRPLVVPEAVITVGNTFPNVADIPADYWHFLRGRVKMTKDEGGCSPVYGVLKIRQYDDEFELSPFDKSSFDWRIVNGVFNENGVQLYAEGGTTLSELNLSYIKKLTYMHNAKQFRPSAPGANDGTYNMPDGTTTLSGSVNCELPDHTHREIVDIAVLLATGEIQASDYQIKYNKLNFNKLN